MTAVTVFDAYGTLFDPHGLTGRLETAFPGLGAAISASWREAQLRYTWLRSLMDRWAPFDMVTGDALRWACDLHGVEPDERLVNTLLDAYRLLPAYPDVAPARTPSRDRSRSSPTARATCSSQPAARRESGINSRSCCPVTTSTSTSPIPASIDSSRRGWASQRTRYASSQAIAGTAPALLPSASRSCTSRAGSSRRNDWEQIVQPRSSICETSPDPSAAVWRRCDHYRPFRQGNAAPGRGRGAGRRACAGSRTPRPMAPPHPDGEPRRSAGARGPCPPR